MEHVNLGRKPWRSIEEARRGIQRNMPKERSPLIWGKITERIIRSKCGRYQVEIRGDDAAKRYYAFVVPDRVIGHRLLTEEHGKQICEQHASPLPLEGPKTPLIEREPGCDDDLGEDE